MIKESCVIGPGTYRWEFLDDKIVVSECSAPPEDTLQWVTIAPSGLCRFKLVGSNNHDIAVVVLLARRTRTQDA
jgi:hypothetical protein